MRRVITYGLTAQYNLGCPSILHGIYQLLRAVYGEDFEMINLQVGPVPDEAISDMPFQTIQVERYRAKDFFKVLFGRKLESNRERATISDVKDLFRTSDVVIDLYGICFCDKFGKPHYIKGMLPLHAMLRFPFSCFAKKYHVRSV